MANIETARVDDIVSGTLPIDDANLVKDSFILNTMTFFS
jgi:hypothetical protein